MMAITARFSGEPQPWIWKECYHPLAGVSRPFCPAIGSPDHQRTRSVVMIRAWASRGEENDGQRVKLARFVQRRHPQREQVVAPPAKSSRPH